MIKKEITEKVTEIVCNKFWIDSKEITPELSLFSIGVDSLDLAEVIFYIESDFQIIFPDDISDKFYSCSSVTVADFIASVADYIDMVINK